MDYTLSEGGGGGASLGDFKGDVGLFFFFPTQRKNRPGAGG